MNLKAPISPEEQQRILDAASPYMVAQLLDKLVLAQATLLAIKGHARDKELIDSDFRRWVRGLLASIVPD